MTQRIGVTETATGPTVEEADMGVDNRIVLLENADIIIALPGSGKTYYVKKRRGHAVDLDIRGSRYVLQRTAFKQAMTNIAQILIDEELQVVAHPAALDWDALIRNNPGLTVAFVLPAPQFEDILCKRVVERGGDPAWVADAATNFRRWCARANHEKFHAERLGVHVLHYYLTWQVPYLSCFWRQEVANPYEACRPDHTPQESDSNDHV